jgi:hypothetical protein
MDRVVKWMPPEEGTLKINTRLCMHDDGTGAMGTVMRGSDGRLRASLDRWINMAGLTLMVGSTLVAEAEALNSGVHLIPPGTRETHNCGDQFPQVGFTLEK